MSRVPTPDFCAKFPSPSPFDDPEPVTPIQQTAYALSQYEHHLRLWHDDQKAFADEVANVSKERHLMTEAFRVERQKEEERARQARIVEGKRKRVEYSNEAGPSKRAKVSEGSDGSDNVSVVFKISFFYVSDSLFDFRIFFLGLQTTDPRRIPKGRPAARVKKKSAKDAEE